MASNQFASGEYSAVADENRPTSEVKRDFNLFKSIFIH